jgi:hypothetical protein
LYTTQQLDQDQEHEKSKSVANTSLSTRFGMAEDENIWITGDLDFVESEVLPGQNKRRGFSDAIPISQTQTATFLTGNDVLQGILHKIKASIKQQDTEVAKAGAFIPATEPSFI